MKLSNVISIAVVITKAYYLLWKKKNSKIPPTNIKI